MPYVKYMYDVILIDDIRKLLSWYIGIQYDWKVNVGKCGKWFKRLLDNNIYNRYISIYSGVEYEDIWNKLFKAGELIREIGTDYIKWIKNLPGKSENIYEGESI